MTTKPSFAVGDRVFETHAPHTFLNGSDFPRVSYGTVVRVEPSEFEDGDQFIVRLDTPVTDARLSNALPHAVIQPWMVGQWKKESVE